MTTETIDQAEATHGRVHEGVEAAKEKATHAFDAAKTKATAAVDQSREKAKEAARQTVETIEANPLGIVVGGLALGALVAAVLPRSQREKDLLAPVGKKVSAGATAAIAAAKEAGKAELDQLGLKGAATGQAKSLLDGVLKAATSAGKAAAEAGREGVKGR